MTFVLSIVTSQFFRQRNFHAPWNPVNSRESQGGLREEGTDEKSKSWRKSSCILTFVPSIVASQFFILSLLGWENPKNPTNSSQSQGWWRNELMKKCGFKSISDPGIYDGQVTFAARPTIPRFKMVPGKWYNYRQAMNSGEPVWDVVKPSYHIQVMVHPRLGEFPYQGVIITK